MLVRIISAAVMLAIVIPALLLSNTFVFDAVVALVSVLACCEMISCTGFKKAWGISVPAVIISAFLPLTVRVIDLKVGLYEMFLLVFVLYMFVILGISVFSHGKHDLKDTATLYLLLFYVIFGLVSVLAVRRIENGQYLYLLTLISACVTDSGAYFIGVFFGKHKLIPDISPKKTVEGAIGGLSFCVAGFILFGVIMQSFFGFSPDYLLLGILGFVLSIVSMCGDLVASFVKRRYDLKDFSNLIPGHGGIMDRIDSVIATASVLAVVLNIPYISQNIL